MLNNWHQSSVRQKHTCELTWNKKSLFGGGKENEPFWVFTVTVRVNPPHKGWGTLQKVKIMKNMFVMWCSGSVWEVAPCSVFQLQSTCKQVQTICVSTQCCYSSSTQCGQWFHVNRTVNSDWIRGEREPCGCSAPSTWEKLIRASSVPTTFSPRHRAVSRLPIGHWCRNSTPDLDHPFNNLNPVSLGCRCSFGTTSPSSLCPPFLTFLLNCGKIKPWPADPHFWVSVMANPHPSSLREQLIIIIVDQVPSSPHYHLTLWFAAIYSEVSERGIIIQTEQLPSLHSTT